MKSGARLVTTTFSNKVDVSDVHSDVDDLQAVALASRLGQPKSLGDIVREYAHVLETAADYRQALRHYEDYMVSNPCDVNLQFLVQVM